MRGLTMLGLLPVIALSFIVLILNHQAVMSSIRPVKDTTQHLKRIGGVVNVNQTRKEKPRLDFIVAGFPKCGTTTLLYAFLRHNETRIAPNEFCGMNGKSEPKTRISSLNTVLQSFNASIPVKRGIKCPMAISDTTGIEVISANFRHTKIIIGVRHPLKFFQSFFNYRCVSRR